MEDLYTLYVLILKIGEEFFWHAPISEVERVAENKIAYDAWVNNPATE